MRRESRPGRVPRGPATPTASFAFVPPPRSPPSPPPTPFVTFPNLYFHYFQHSFSESPELRHAPGVSSAQDDRVTNPNRRPAPQLASFRQFSHRPRVAARKLASFRHSHLPAQPSHCQCLTRRPRPSRPSYHCPFMGLGSFCIPLSRRTHRAAAALRPCHSEALPALLRSNQVPL